MFAVPRASRPSRRLPSGDTTRRALILTGVAALAAACAPAPPPALGPDGQPVQRVYRISAAEADRIPFRALDAVNALRAERRLPPLELNAQLTAAAATHSRDMSAQARPWHFGSDGSSPVARVARAGYRGEMRGELISETFETELETITAWMADRDTRAVLLDREARDMGLAWHQDPNGKLWWTLVTGTPGRAAQPLAGGGFGSDPGPFTPGVFEEVTAPRPFG
ncbi:MAG: divisome-associated lipoprotein DalA [Alkalilacustris sp.]